jgi:hypothetical protein
LPLLVPDGIRKFAARVNDQNLVSVLRLVDFNHMITSTQRTERIEYMLEISPNFSGNSFNLGFGFHIHVSNLSLIDMESKRNDSSQSLVKPCEILVRMDRLWQRNRVHSTANVNADEIGNQDLVVGHG